MYSLQKRNFRMKLHLDFLYLYDLKNLFFLFITSLCLSCILFFISYFIAKKEAYTEKLSAYECGFEPYEDARNQFDVQFYLIAIIYLIFDIETVLLYPWAVSLNNISSLSFWTIFDFIIELWLGYVYIWRTRILTWTI